MKDRRRGETHCCQLPVQKLGLRQRTRVPVEQKTFFTVGPRNSANHNLVYYVITDKRARRQDGPVVQHPHDLRRGQTRSSGVGLTEAQRSDDEYSTSGGH